jgi:hypothetical protein
MQQFVSLKPIYVWSVALLTLLPISYSAQAKWRRHGLVYRVQSYKPAKIQESLYYLKVLAKNLDDERPRHPGETLKIINVDGYVMGYKWENDSSCQAEKVPNEWAEYGNAKWQWSDGTRVYSGWATVFIPTPCDQGKKQVQWQRHEAPI